jgi:hypothetical protein
MERGAYPWVAYTGWDGKVSGFLGPCISATTVGTNDNTVSRFEALTHLAVSV